MKKILYFLTLNLFVLTLVAQPARERKPGQENTKATTQQTMQGFNIPADGCNFMMVSQPPKQKKGKTPKKQQPTESYYPEKIEAYICFEPSSAYYTEEGLNILDSIYSIAFAQGNTKFYKMTIEAYDDADPLNELNASLARDRAVMIFNYFSSREGTEFIIKRTPSTYTHSCSGEMPYYIKYKMPFDFKWTALYDKTAEERTKDGINLTGKVRLLIEDDPEGCLGEYFDYYYPSQDSVLSGNHASVTIPKGALESITHTKDTIEYTCNISYKEFLSFEELTNNYHLIPHKKQFLINAGYIVIDAEHQPDYNSCKNIENFQPIIKVQIPIELQQNDARLKFYAKVYDNKGKAYYKSIPTKKEKDKETKLQTLIADLTAFQLDTIYIGKKVEEKELSDYFFSAKEGEPGAFPAMGGWLKPYKLNKKGQYIIKKQMQMVLRKPIGDIIEE
jgi:hypothetical protein